VALALLLPRAWDDPAWMRDAVDRKVSLTLNLVEPPSFLPAREADPHAGGGAAGPARATERTSPREVPAGDLLAVLEDRASRAREAEGQEFFPSGALGSGGSGGGRGGGIGSGSRDGASGGPVLERLPWPKYPASAEGGKVRTVRVRVLVASDGSVRSAELEAGQVPDAFTEEALHVARLARFRASRDRARLDRWVVLPITFHP
jgi:TonB family protein